MNLDWIMSPLTMYGALAAGGMACLFTVVSARVEMARYVHRYAEEKARMEQHMNGLTARIQALAEDASERSELTQAPSPSPSLAMNQNKRSEALRMYRRGSDAHTIAATVGLSSAEAALLGKVHHILNDSEQNIACVG